MTEQLTPEHFRPHIDKLFRVQGGRHGLTLTAVQAAAGPHQTGAAGLRQPFNLIFEGPPNDILYEGSYMLEVEGGPCFELHVMPIHTPAPGRQDYQAAFN